MKKILICLTYQDRSAPLFLTGAIKEMMQINFLLYEESEDYIDKYLKSEDYDYIYLRYPFNGSNLSLSDVKARLDIIIKNKREAYLVDNLKSVKGVLFEDKWRQYQSLSDFMPETKVLQSDDQIDFDRYLIKKRISTRGEQVLFELPNDIVHEDYIVQKIINVEKEFRVYSIFNKIIDQVVIRSPKTSQTKIKVLHVEKITQDLHDYVAQIDKKIDYDFTGYDIALDKNGKYYLIEVNRSCLFGGVFRETKVNLAENFIGELLKR